MRRIYPPASVYGSTYMVLRTYQNKPLMLESDLHGALPRTVIW